MATGGRVFDAVVPNTGTFGTTTALDMTSGTISVWIKNLEETSVAGAILSTSNAAFNKGFIFAWESGGFDQRFTFYDGTDWRFSSSIGADPALAAGWHHVLVRWTSGSSGAFFLDGAAIGTFTPATLVAPTGETKTLNTYPSGGGLTVEYSELAVWNSSLSNGDVALLAGGDSPQAVGSPVGHWRFNTTGTTVEDLIGTADVTLSHNVAQSSDGPAVDEPSSGVERRVWAAIIY